MAECIVVLGMHRSGTSALAGVLHALGVDLGPHLLPADANNERGFFEHMDVLHLHEQLLREVGSAWDDPRPLPPDWCNGPAAERIGGDIERVCRTHFASSPLWAIKDPRMCRLLPLWMPIFRRLEVRPRFLICLRHPSEVRRSLYRRNGMVESIADALWMLHVVESERATRGYARAFLAYEELLEDWRRTLGDALGKIGIDLEEEIARSVSAVNGFLSGSLRHHRADDNKEGWDVPGVALYEAVVGEGRDKDVSQETRVRIDLWARAHEMGCRAASMALPLVAIARDVPRTHGTDPLTTVCQFFVPTAGAYTEEESHRQYLLCGRWVRLALRLLVPLERLRKPLRLDPANAPAFIRVPEITVHAISREGAVRTRGVPYPLGRVGTGGDAVRLPTQERLEVLSVGQDPQLYLPGLQDMGLTGPVEVRLWLLVDLAAHVIGDALQQLPWQRPQVLGSDPSLGEGAAGDPSGQGTHGWLADVVARLLGEHRYLTAEMARQAGLLDDNRARCEQARRELVSLERELNQDRKTAGQLARRLAASKERNVALIARLEQCRVASTEQQARGEVLARELHEVQRRRDEVSAEMNGLTAQWQELATQWQGREANLMGERDALAESLAAMKSSWSWRLTDPLRKLLQLLQRSGR